MSAHIQITDITCPITFDIMEDPVTGTDGVNYDRKAITTWLANHGTSPTTRRPMHVQDLIPNRLLKDMIQRYNAEIAASPQAAMNVKPFLDCPLVLTGTLEKGDGSYLNIQVTPPADGKRQPLVMGLGLDTSGSMATLACNTNETGGLAFTRMDLTKHAVRTLITWLGPDDILYLVPFNDKARLLLPPTPMDDKGKATAFAAINSLKADGSTNIWHCLQTLNMVAKKPEFTNSNVVIALLTDGEPNIRPPQEDESIAFNAIKRNGNLSTFGFGNQLNSKLLGAIGTVGGGGFGYITDYSMVATVFINWAASVLATGSRNRQVTVTYSDGTKTTHDTSLIQYGQPRNITFQTTKTPLTVSLGETSTTAVTEGTHTGYIWARYLLLQAMTHCIGHAGDRSSYQGLFDKYKDSSDNNARELVRDVKPMGEDDEGQVSMAPRFYATWGQHYSRSYKRSLELEQCMNFKDPGLQILGGALFKENQVVGDEIFCNLPPLEPTGLTYAYGGGSRTVTSVASLAPDTMSSVFNNPRGGCWAAGTKVRMADTTTMSIEDIRSGMRVFTPSGAATVQYTLKLQSRKEDFALCNYKGLFVTPWHPVLTQSQTGDNTWVFPGDHTDDTVVYSHTTVYNLVLSGTQSHAIRVNGVDSICLGHGDTTSPVVGHEFFGSRDSILKALSTMRGFNNETDGGDIVCEDLVEVRDSVTGRVCNWYDASMENV